MLRCHCLPKRPLARNVLARDVADWLRLFRLLAQLGMSAMAQDNLKSRWRLVQPHWRSKPPNSKAALGFSPYVFLLTGLLAYLSSDTLVDDALLHRLRQAQDALPLGKRAQFIEAVISQLHWRRQIVEDFWSGLRVGDLRRSRLIYQEELSPAFGERMPLSVRIGMILVDWDEGSTHSQELHHRLAVLQHDASEASGQAARPGAGISRGW